MRRMHPVVALLLAVLVAFPTAALATEPVGRGIEALDTQGVPVCCGTAAMRMREALSMEGVDAYPALFDANGNQAPADRAAATGLQVRFGNMDAAVERTFVLRGDLAGTGQFNLAQLVLFANCMSTGAWTELQAAAGDLNGDGGPTITDLVILAGYYRQASPPAPVDPYPTPDEPGPAGKTLVVWFSASGRTEAVAQIISRELDADTFEIVPVEPYTQADLDYNDPSSRVCREHDNPELRDIALEQAEVANIEEYDTIFIGYPIWWGNAAWPVDTFVKANNFGSITVIPFCTSASSPLGQSASNLAEMATGGDWLEGHRFSSNASEQSVVGWLDSLPLD